MTRRTDPAPFILPTVPAWPEAMALGESRKAFALGVQMQAQALKSVLRWQAESLSFLARRSQENIQFLDDIVADEEFRDAFDITAAYMQNAAMDWMNETGRLAALCPQMASEAARSIQQQAAAAAEDMAASTVAA